MNPWLKFVLGVVALLAACRFGMEIERDRQAAHVSVATNNLRVLNRTYYNADLDQPRFLTDEPYPP